MTVDVILLLNKFRGQLFLSVNHYNNNLIAIASFHVRYSSALNKNPIRRPFMKLLISSRKLDKARHFSYISDFVFAGHKLPVQGPASGPQFEDRNPHTSWLIIKL